MAKPNLKLIKNLVADAIDSHRLQTGRLRQELVMNGQSPDYAPLLLGHRKHFVEGIPEDLAYVNAEHFVDGGVAVSEFDKHPHFVLAEQTNYPEKMLYEALWGILSWARTPSDAQLSIRPAIIGVIPTCFGIKYEVNKQGTMWFPEHIDLDQALEADLSDIETLGLVPKVIEYLEFFRDNTVDGVNVSCPIAAGPWNVIDVMLGVDLYTQLYDNPEKIHALLDKITEAIASVLKLYKAVLGEPNGSANIGPLYMACGGVKIGSDSMVMVSPEMYEEFVQPYTVKLCQEFSGGYHHSCGCFADKLDALCQAEHLTVINFGEPQLWNMPDAVEKIYAGRKVYYGGWLRLPDEPIEDYLRRGVKLCGPQRNRAILHAMGEEMSWPDSKEMMDMWQTLQDEIYPRERRL